MSNGKLIEETANQTARAVVAELRRVGIIKENRLDSFKKTERVLYEYPGWRGSSGAQTQRFCTLIQKALDSIADDPYFDIIELKYFQRWTHERIAEHFDVDVSVISKRRTRLINQIRAIVFSDDFIRELYEA